MKVHWTDTAEGHLDAVYAHIAQDSPEYARHMVDRLTRRSQPIADFPFSGRRAPEYDFEQIREVIEGSFRIIYLPNIRTSHKWDKQSRKLSTALRSPAHEERRSGAMDNFRSGSKVLTMC
jgi:plasmid stabilization system protein ParE